MTKTTAPAKMLNNGVWLTPTDFCDYGSCKRTPEFIVSQYSTSTDKPLAITERRPMCKRHVQYHMGDQGADVWTMSGQPMWVSEVKAVAVRQEVAA